MSDVPAEIRTATAADVEAVLALWRSGRSAAAVTPDTPEALAALLAHDPGSLIVAEAPEEGIVGTLIAAFDGWRGNMYRLVVTPPQRRQGIARALVEEAHAHLQARGATRVTALVGEEHAALGFWGAVGYDRDGIHRLVRNL